MSLEHVSQTPAHEVYERLADEGWLEVVIAPTTPTKKVSEPGVDMYRAVISPFELMRVAYDPKAAFPAKYPEANLYAPKPFDPRQ